MIDLPRPVPEPDELLVRVHAGTVNRTDCGFRAGHPWFIRAMTGVRKPKRTILGNEFAGVVEAVGPAVEGFEVGDRVLGYDDTRFGGHGEYMTIGQDAAITTMPPDRSFEAMVPITEGAHYALANLRAADVGEGTDVLVYGATGAIGSAAVQLAKSLGAFVTAVCGSDQVDLVNCLGADRVIDRFVSDFTADTRRYDLVLDAVGKSTFGQCRGLLKPHGIYTSTDLGRLSQNPLLVMATRFSSGRRVLIPLPSIDRAMVEYLKDLVVGGQFTPVVDRTYLLDEIVEAYRYVESGQKVGNVVLAVAA